MQTLFPVPLVTLLPGLHFFRRPKSNNVLPCSCMHESPCITGPHARQVRGGPTPLMTLCLCPSSPSLVAGKTERPGFWGDSANYSFPNNRWDTSATAFSTAYLGHHGFWGDYANCSIPDYRWAATATATATAKATAYSCPGLWAGFWGDSANCSFPENRWDTTASICHCHHWLWE